MAMLSWFQRYSKVVVALIRGRLQPQQPFKKNLPAATKPGLAEQKPAAKTLSPATANDLEREIRLGRKFSMAEALGREGGSFMKGESTIPRPLRAKHTINQFITQHLRDPSSALSTTLQTWTNNDIRVSKQLDTPLIALAQILESLLGEAVTFSEFSRQVAIAQSHITGDRPYFQAPGSEPHPNADYTHHTIQTELLELLATLEAR
ncbi:MAG: hypothetical protein AAFO06_19300 [Cyanobacteria bacterium J06597_16]